MSADLSCSHTHCARRQHAAIQIRLTIFPRGLCKLKPPLTTTLTSWPEPNGKKNTLCRSGVGGYATQMCVVQRPVDLSPDLRSNPQPSLLCESASVGISRKIIRGEAGGCQRFPSRTDIFSPRERETQLVSWDQPS